MSPTPSPARRVAFAIGAHPDDIEFMMAGTLLLLKAAGAEIPRGTCATAAAARQPTRCQEIIRLRREEAQCLRAGGRSDDYPPFADDLDLFYTQQGIQRVTAVVRMVKPDILLVPSLSDYMEDHQNAARLAVTGAFSRAISTLTTIPPVAPWDGDMVVYHAEPHGLRDNMRRLIRPGLFVDISATLAHKREMLAQHRSQKEWLDASQGMDSYLLTMEEIARQTGTLSGRFSYAEGWRRHLHLGFSAEDRDPLSEWLGEMCWIDPAYEAGLG